MSVLVRSSEGIVSVEVLPDLDAIYMQPRGEFSVAFALTWGAAILEHPDARPDMHQIVDLSLVEPGTALIEDVKLVRDQLAARNPEQDFLVAYVAPSDLVFGMTRVFTSSSDMDMPRGRGVFRSLDLAKAWIREQGT